MKRFIPVLALLLFALAGVPTAQAQQKAPHKLKDWRQQAERVFGERAQRQEGHPNPTANPEQNDDVLRSEHPERTRREEAQENRPERPNRTLEDIFSDQEKLRRERWDQDTRLRVARHLLMRIEDRR